MISPDLIFSLKPDEFSNLALEIFDFQYYHVPLYAEFCNFQKKSPLNVKSLLDIPFLPIELFKSHEIIANGKSAQKIFESSGTTGMQTSKHYVADLSIYERSFQSGFKHFFGNVEDYVILALLPSYTERGNSSLVYMVEKLIHQSGQNASSFVTNEDGYLYELLDVLRTTDRKTILLGVTFALLDFSEQYKIDWPHLIVMETGGMKGRRIEITREEVHTQLSTTFEVDHIYSEYGMTELLSQAYSMGEGIFKCPPWMKVLCRDVYEPSRLIDAGNTGAVNIIDLANLYSCSFIATSDLGRVGKDGSFEILGRVDGSDLRGCNLMAL